MTRQPSAPVPSPFTLRALQTVTCARRRCWPLAALLAAWLAGAAWCGTAAAQERSFVIDPHASSVQIRLNREGVFSLLAHDHVLVADGFAGRVTVDPQNVAAASMQLTFPVGSIVVDPPELRRELGIDGKLDEEDRADIRETMLSEEQLDEARFPRIVATLEGVSGQLPDLVLALKVRIRQVEKVLSVPAQVRMAAGELEASGEFKLTQSDFGIEPFSALLGSIAVEDVVTVRFRVVARAEGA